MFSFFETPGVGGARFDIATLVLRALDDGPAYVGLINNLVGWSLAGDSIAFEFGPTADLFTRPKLSDPEAYVTGRFG